MDAGFFFGAAAGAAASAAGFSATTGASLRSVGFLCVISLASTRRKERVMFSPWLICPNTASIPPAAGAAAAAAGGGGGGGGGGTSDAPPFS